MRFSLLLVALSSTGVCSTVVEYDVLAAASQHMASHKRCSTGSKGPQSAVLQSGKYFGTATAVGQWSDNAYSEILNDTAIFNSLTPAVGMKWEDTEPLDGWFDFADGDAIAHHASEHGRSLRCHALVWPYQALPQWLTKRKWSRQGLIDVMWRHITTVVSQYKGACQAWDVVNEALLDDGSFRPSLFLDVIGPEYITIAFLAAAQADPKAKLYYNDYNIDNDWSVEAPVASATQAPSYQYSTHQDAAYGRMCYGVKVTNKIEGAKCLVKTIRAHGGKVDGVGLQGHYVFNSTPTAQKLGRIMQGFADLDLDVAITELDIRMDFANINAVTTGKQAQGYADVLAACKNTPRCVGVTLWDFTDKYSWVPEAMPGFGSAHPWDSNMVRKQKIWDAIMRGWGAEEPHC